MDTETQFAALLSPPAEYLAAVKVFPVISHLRRDVTKSIDSALSWDQLTASDINFAIVRPIVFKYARLHNPSIVYACLVVRSHFLALAEDDLAYSGVSLSRASLCEILAMKLVSHFANNRIQLVSVLTTCWSPLAGAPETVIEEVKGVLGAAEENEIDDPQSALEMAIATRAKAFIASPIIQTVVNDIYSGQVVYSSSAATNRSLVADNYKQRAIEIYDMRKASLLHHPRLRVPKYGALLEFLNFVVLFAIFVLALSKQDKNAMNVFEIVFIVFASAFTLAEYTASQEHGWGIYIANMWNVFDTSFVIVFLLYIILRIKGLATGDPSSSELGFDILACGACILFPRLAFFLVSNNVVVLALRGMIAEFIFFMCIAAICFSGLLFTLWTLASDKWKLKSIAWLMVQIWFGNTYLSFGQAESFHPVFGPILMTGFAALSNTLLLTILISILSNTFARIDANANQEYLFQFTIITLEGMKSDALFSYQPPFNLLAFAILWPASFVLSPRSLHTANVFLIRLTSFPILIAISLYERSFQQQARRHDHTKSGNSNNQGLRHTTQSAAQSLYNSLPRAVKTLPVLEAVMGTHAEDIYEALFDVEQMVDEDDISLFEGEEGEEEEDHDRIGLRSWASRERHAQGVAEEEGDLSTEPASATTNRLSNGNRNNMDSPTRPRSETQPSTPGRSGRPSSIPRSPTQTSLRQSASRPRYLSLRTEATRVRNAATGEISTPASPLARLFGGGRRGLNESTGVGDGIMVGDRMEKLEERLKRVQELLEERESSGADDVRGGRDSKRKDTKKGDMSGLKGEMKELQERQARIESLLMMLTRGMRNEVGTPGTPSRNDTF